MLMKLIKKVTVMVLLLVTMLTTMNQTVLAAENSGEVAAPVVCSIKKVTDLFQGPVGQGIGIAAVIFLAVGLFLGKITWGVAIATAIGIGVIFGAGEIVTWLSTSSSDSNLKALKDYNCD